MTNTIRCLLDLIVHPHQNAVKCDAFALRGRSLYTIATRWTPDSATDVFGQGFVMDRIRIVGGAKLNGTIPISGAKNAALPLMIAALLSDETLVLDNVPRLADVAQLQRILGNHGVDILSAGKKPGDHEYQGQTLHISPRHIIDTTAPYELVSKMRASFWVIAPLLAADARSEGIAARWLRDRHAAGGSAHHGAGKARRGDRDRRRLRDRESARRPQGR